MHSQVIRFTNSGELYVLRRGRYLSEDAKYEVIWETGDVVTLPDGTPAKFLNAGWKNKRLYAQVSMFPNVPFEAPIEWLEPFTGVKRGILKGFRSRVIRHALTGSSVKPKKE